MSWPEGPSSYAILHTPICYHNQLPFKPLMFGLGSPWVHINRYFGSFDSMNCNRIIRGFFLVYLSLTRNQDLNDHNLDDLLENRPNALLGDVVFCLMWNK